METDLNEPCKIKISTVTPIYSGENYLTKLVAELDVLREKWIQTGAPIELAEAIFVDDGSIDNSFELLEALEKKYPWVVLVCLSKNFGQHPATTAGILYSSGDWVVTLDEDLQHPPKFIGELIKSASIQSLDVVYANPAQRVHQNVLRDFGSLVFKRALSLLTGNKNISKFNSFRVIRGSVARAACSVSGHSTYFDIALSWFSDRVGVVALNLKDTRHINTGKSGYNLMKLFSHAKRLILSTHTKALRVIGIMGFLTFTFGLTYGLYIIVDGILWSPDITIKGWSSLIVTILFMGGIGTFLSSILLEYLSIILLHIQGKPTFFVIDRDKDKILQKFYQENHDDGYP